VYADFHWNNWNGSNNYGVAAYSALIPGNWVIYQGPIYPIGNTGDHNTYFQYDLPSGMISLLIGADIIDYNTPELSNLDYTGSNTITAQQWWYACSAAVLAVNTTAATVNQQMRASIYTPAYDETPESWQDTGIFADGRAQLIILQRSP
jgi:hypothetical protein